MQKDLRRWIAAAFIVSVNLLLWIIPSDLAYNVAQQRDILLGRYTVDKFTAILIVTVISLLLLAGIRSKKQQKTGREKRQDYFKTIAVTISIILSVFFIDVALRFLKTGRYTGTAASFHRIPNTISKGIRKDVPAVAFSYPLLKAGFPEFEYTLTVDGKGFRNKTDLTSCDIVTLGDSFAEGSHASDEHPWPVLLGQKSGLTVYNLGMSGAGPFTYVETLKRFGLVLKPEIVICMLYEGNDFRDGNFARGKIVQAKGGRNFSLKVFLRSSPVRSALKNLFIKLLGPVASGKFANDGQSLFQPHHPLYAVSWLPVTAPGGASGKNYDFDLKSLLDHYRCADKNEIIKSKGWQGTFGKIRELKQICSENGIRFIVVYAPDKPHVLPPLMKNRLPAEQLRAFMSLKKKNLPAAKELMDILLSRLDVQESAMKEFCQKESVEFVSLTGALRQAVAEGTQVYFTYDQHWSPPGHEIVAQLLCDYLKNQQIK